MKKLLACETQPVTLEGLRSVLNGHAELMLIHSVQSLEEALRWIRSAGADLCLVDKSFGIQAILDWLGEVRRLSRLAETGIVVWGSTVSEPEAIRLLQHGVQGILRKTAPVSSVLACLEAVARGSTWIEESLLRGSMWSRRSGVFGLTPREQQVLALVQQGLKNKEIARELGIRPGTVKIHLKHIFEKTGVRGRYSLALSGLAARVNGRVFALASSGELPRHPTAEARYSKVSTGSD